MRTSFNLRAPAHVLAAFAVAWSSACSPHSAQVAGNRAVTGAPQPRDTVSRAGQQAVPPTVADWTPAMPLTGRAIKCENGRIKTFVCENVELLSYLPKEAIGQSPGVDPDVPYGMLTDIWGWHDSTTGREFVLIGGKGTAFVEVTDPVNPKYLGVLPRPATAEAGQVQSVKVYQHYAFVGYEGGIQVPAGIQVFDLTQLRAVKRPATFQETVHYDGLANTHTIAVNPASGFLYVNGSNTCGGGLHILDVRTPTKPTKVGCYPDTLGGKNPTGYIHDAQCVIYRGPDRQYQGREICVDYAQTGIGIVDVTEKEHPRAISSFTYPKLGYTHQGWFTEDQRYIFVDDELDERVMSQAVGLDSVRTRTIGFDLNDLDDPVLLVEFYHQTRRADHNLYIRGRYMYQGNYSAGLRIIDVANPKAPKEVGYLSRQESDTAGPLAWGPYPYFKNDVVAVSMSTGLVLARLLKRATK